MSSIQVQHDGSRRLYNRLRNLVKDPRKQSVIFHNEFQKYASCDREPGESMAKWHVRLGEYSYNCCFTWGEYG